MSPGTILVVPIASFLIGSIPFSWIIGRLIRGVDIRTTGSGNVGATNLARATGYGPGIAALLLDAGKGVAAVMLAGWMSGGGPGGVILESVAGALVILGHNFTPFLRFRGGKGVATGAGVFGVLAPLGLVAALAVFIVVVIASRIVSLGSITAAAALPVAVLLLYDALPVTMLALGVAALVIVRHRTNIVRILRRTEDRIGDASGDRTGGP